jgi:hypothetical protein
VCVVGTRTLRSKICPLLYSFIPGNFVKIFNFIWNLHYGLKKQIIHDVISPNILCTRRIQRPYTYVHTALLARARMAHMLITEFRLAPWHHTKTCPCYSLFCLLFPVSKKYHYSKGNSSIMCVCLVRCFCFCFCFCFYFFFCFFFCFCFCFVLFCFVLFCFVLFCFVLFCFVLFCFVLYSTLF